MDKFQRILIIIILVLLAGYAILKGSNIYWEYSSGLNKVPKEEQQTTQKEQPREERREAPAHKKVDAPIKEI